LTDVLQCSGIWPSHGMSGSGSSATAWKSWRYAQITAVQMPHDQRPGPQDALAHPAVA
jgi:hypothetical protein